MQIILATKPQLNIVQQLAYKIWPVAYVETGILSQEQMDYMLDNFYSIDSLENQLEKGHIFILLKEENEFLGFASYETNSDDSNKTKLHKIYVLPNTQGKGVGKFLLNEVEIRAKKANNSALFLNVNKYNKAQEFYKKLNFTITKEEVIDIGNGYVMDDFVMEKSL